MFWKITLLILAILFFFGLFNTKAGKQNFYNQRWYPIKTISGLSQLKGEKLVFQGTHYTTFDPKTFDGNQSREGYFMMNLEKDELLFLDENLSDKISGCYLVTNGTYGGYDICRTTKFPNTAYSQTSNYNVEKNKPLKLLAENKDGLLIEFYYENGKYTQYFYENMPFHFSNIALSPDNSTVFFHALEWVDSKTDNVKNRINRFYIFKETEEGKTGNLTVVYEDEQPNIKAYGNFQFSKDGHGVYYTHKNTIYYLDLKKKESSIVLSTPFKIIGQLKVSAKGQLAFIGDGYFQTPGPLCIVDPQQPDKLNQIKSSAFLNNKVSNFLWSPIGNKIAFKAVESESDILEGVDLKRASSYRIQNRKLYIYDMESEKILQVYNKHINPNLVAWVEN